MSQELRTARLPRPHVLVGYQWSHTGLRPGRKTSHNRYIRSFVSHLPQIRACTSRAPGSSSHEFATRAIRRRGVDTAQVSMYLACFPPTGQETAPPVGWGTGPRTVGSGGGSTPFGMDLSPAPNGHVSSRPPPKIPYCGFSPVRLQVPGTAQFSGESSRLGRWLKFDPHIHHLPTRLALTFGIASAGKYPASVCGASASDESTWTQRSSLGELLITSPSSLADLIRRSGLLRSISQRGWL